MAAPIRWALARSYLLGADLTATVTDAGGTNRAVTIASSNTYVRPLLAESGWTGTSMEEPRELFARAVSQLNAGAGGGTWSISLHTDGRTAVSWSGSGSGTISAGGLLYALGFVASTGAISSGSTVYSSYPALGLVLWPYSQEDTGWLPESDSAVTEDARGRAYVYRNPHIRWGRQLTASWVPRGWLTGSGEYFTPAWSSDLAGAGAFSANAPDYDVSPGNWSWCDAVFGCEGSVAWGFTEDILTVIEGGELHTVYLGREMYEAGRWSMPAELATYAPRRDVLVSLRRTGTITL